MPERGELALSEEQIRAYLELLGQHIQGMDESREMEQGRSMVPGIVGGEQPDRRDRRIFLIGMYTGLRMALGATHATKAMRELDSGEFLEKLR